MATPAKLYVKGIKEKLNHYYAAWLPNHVLKLGDIGVLNDGFFTQVTSLEDLNISFDIREDDAPTPIDYTSSSGASVTFKAQGETNSFLPNIPTGKAGIGVEFTKKGGFFVKAEKSFEPSIENIANVQKTILRAYKSGKWNKDWAVIVRLVEVPYGSILISNSSESKIELSVEGDVSINNLDLGKGNLNFAVNSQKGDIFKFIGAQDITPFFQLARLKKKIFGSPEVTMKASRIYTNPFDLDAPEIIRNKPEIEDSLYFDLILDSELELPD